ncbi:MAG TPA: hypothetical protein VN181_12280 [Thermoanaerobaculia bacterium]|nr:hypothetical protein [Thermoanaerobaculia bacterium]
MIVAILLVAGVASAEDSPLVALAKRTNRKGSKTPVITHETLANSVGRVSTAAETTTSSSAPFTVPPVVMPAAPAPPKRELTAASTEPAPETGYPASTARNVEAQSSARTIDPSSGAGRIEAQSTVRTIQPESSAQNIPAQAVPPQ